MSITSAMYTGVSGLLANAEGLNVIGNNLSNVNTTGFKGSRTLFSDMLSANIGDNSQIGRGTQIQKVDNLFSQGSFETTEVVSDVAVQGDSFFVLGSPTAANGTAVTGDQAYYTRAGAFRVDGDYNLVNPDGYKVLDITGTPITLSGLDPAYAKITRIDTDGTITYLATDGTTNILGGASPIKVGTLLVPNKAALIKVGGTLYEATDPATGITSATTEFASANGTSEKIIANSLESSNVDMASEFVKMILTQRAYSANSKTIITADEMTQEVLNLKR